MAENFIELAKATLDNAASTPETLPESSSASALIGCGLALVSIAESLEKIAACVNRESPTSSWLQVLSWKDMP